MRVPGWYDASDIARLGLASWVLGRNVGESFGVRTHLL
jgi:hypothetical protein